MLVVVTATPPSEGIPESPLDMHAERPVATWWP
jgi:hypothetical protein